MNHNSLLLGIGFCCLLVLGCQQTSSPKDDGGIVGQVYEIGAPAVPPDWTPPPLEGVRAIVVLDTNKVEVRRVDTDSLGAFKIGLRAGAYVLLVEDSVRPQGENGPFVVAAGQIASVKVYHDNGMR